MGSRGTGGPPRHLGGYEALVTNKSLLYILSLRGKPRGRMIDKFWSVCSMPLGVLICFGPAILVWLSIELKSPPADKHDDHH